MTEMKKGKLRLLADLGAQKVLTDFAREVPHMTIHDLMSMAVLHGIGMGIDIVRDEISKKEKTELNREVDKLGAH